MVKIDNIREMWEKDGAINTSNLSGDAANIPVLHNKYYKIYADESLRLRKLKRGLVILEKNLRLYYSGDMDKGDLESIGRQQWQKRLLKGDITTYIESDNEYLDLADRYEMQKIVVGYLEDILKQIHSRNFQIKSIIDWERFRAGG